MLNLAAAFGYLLSFTAIYTTVLYLLIYLENADEFPDPKPGRYQSVDVIIPAYNEEVHIGKTISSLLALDYPKGKIRLIVIDDGSTDRTLARAWAFRGARVEVSTKENGGKASALNFGLAKAKSELVAILDADSIVERGALKKMVGYFDDPRVAAVTPMMKVWRTSTPLQMLQYGEYIINSFTKKILEQLDSITVTPGPFSVYRRSVFCEIGGFDEETVTEDQEMALRIQASDYRIASAQDAYVFTDAPRGLPELYSQRKRWYRGFLQNIWKHRALFSPRYGDLGLFVLPSSLLLVALGIVSLAYSAFQLAVNGLPANVLAFTDFPGPAEAVLASIALVSFALAAVAARTLREPNPAAVFASAALMFPLLSLFWLGVIFSAVKDSLFGVRLSWKGSR